ncbi:1-deoxy-D-xylulose-5-phosphate synthase [Anaeromyxobacter oryzae]|uniref:1-deoxy-D-xylulose-5-phosphate synthase n=1 Tax=Anaeromyxobacter oryzae TaxID=2918170 RepID=A0ABM7WRW4_9BACT|nr:1-deoxy-D-xylulose-5-phosphate synthase [Anaeromyxobacter oryzae]BDG02217.1 1-deoxy-D-xylulose-5-phosphate synthase 2 [Anaeromyxobacter oryzae]
MQRLLDRIDSPGHLKALPVTDLPRLCEEIRGEIVAVCARTGGHLGSSLGAVELNVALHYVFDSPIDRLVFDVGHQAYAHKLVTGRRDRFATLRTEGGLAGFPERAESEHDAFGVGHASTAISAALGMVEARRIAGGRGKVVALVGDGALTGGVAFEGLNQAGYLRRDLLVVLNDNEMSISPNVGAVSEWLSKRLASPSAERVERLVKAVLQDAPHGARTIDVLHRAVEAAKALVTPGMLFEALGFRYVGPVDGHDVGALVETLAGLARLEGPVLLHALTAKGKGYAPAEADAATRGHALSFFDPRTGRPATRSSGPPPYTDVFAQALCDEMARDGRVVAITAAMLEGTGLRRCQRRFPDRTWDVGIAEQHAVTFAAGLACEGVRPVVAIYSTFLQRALDQIIHDVALQRLPVTFALDRAGLVGADGKTHQGAFDLAYLRCVPGLVLMAPSDENELRHMLRTALELPGPAAFRFPRRAAAGVPAEEPRALPVGRARWLRAGGPRPDVVIAAAGAPALAALSAAAALGAEGIDAAVLDARFVKPLDEEALCDAVTGPRRLVTVEEGCLAGGFGAACLEALAARGVLADGVAVARLGLPDAFVGHGDAGRQLAALGLDAAGIARSVRELLGAERPAGDRLTARADLGRATG